MCVQIYNYWNNWVNNNRDHWYHNNGDYWDHNNGDHNRNILKWLII